MSKSKQQLAVEVLFAQRHGREQSYPGQPGSVLRRGSQHAHPFWQMDILFSDDNYVRMGKQRLHCPKNHLLWIPPQQQHRFQYPESGGEFLSVKCAIQNPPSTALMLNALKGPIKKIVGCIDHLFSEQCRPAVRENTAINHLLAGLFTLCLDEQVQTETMSPLLSRLQKRIKECSGVGISVAVLAEEESLSATHISNVYRRRFGHGLKQAIDQERAQRAEQLLYYADLSVSEIARELEFPDVFCLSKFFKKHKGCSPRVFRQGIQVDASN